MASLKPVMFRNTLSAMTNVVPAWDAFLSTPFMSVRSAVFELSRVRSQTPPPQSLIVFPETVDSSQMYGFTAFWAPPSKVFPSMRMRRCHLPQVAECDPTPDGHATVPAVPDGPT